MQISKSITSEELRRFKETNNEDSRDLKRLTNGRNSVAKSWGKLFEDEDLKTTDWAMRLVHLKMRGATVFSFFYFG